MSTVTTARWPCLALVLGLLVLACTADPRRQPPAEIQEANLRSQLSQAAIIPLDFDIHQELSGMVYDPSTGAARSMKGAVQIMAQFDRIGMLFLPIVPLIGIVGALTAEEAEDVSARVQAILAAMEDETPQLDLWQAVNDAVAREGGSHPAALSRDEAIKASRQTDYSALRERGFPYAIEVGLTALGNSVTQSSDPLIALRLVGVVNLVDTSSGELLFSQLFARLGRRRMQLTDWASDDGQLWEAEYRQSMASLGERIAFELFLRPEAFVYPVQTRSRSFSFYSPAQLSVVRHERPTFKWRLAGEDDEVKDLTWEIKVMQGQVVFYHRSGIAESSHTMEKPLEHCVVYRWSVRGRFEAGGESHATPWAGIQEQDTQGRFPVREDFPLLVLDELRAPRCDVVKRKVKP